MKITKEDRLAAFIADFDAEPKHKFDLDWVETGNDPAKYQCHSSERMAQAIAKIRKETYLKGFEAGAKLIIDNVRYDTWDECIDREDIEEIIAAELKELAKD